MVSECELLEISQIRSRGIHRQGPAHPMSPESKNAKETDKASAVDSNNARGFGSEQISDMEACCADC